MRGITRIKNNANYGEMLFKKNSMNKRNVWSIVLIMEITNGRKPIGNKWVLKIKRDGRY